MGSAVDDVWLETDAPESFEIQQASPRSRWFRTGRVVLVLCLLVPVLPAVLLVAVFFGPALLVTPVAAVDEHFNSVPFEPGRWETKDGEYWVELRADGTGAVRLPNRDGLSDCELDMWEGDVTYTFTPSPGAAHGTLALAMTTQERTGCVGWGPYLSGEGWLGGGYNWDGLDYSKGDPDIVDLVLSRVD